jgi:superfamily II DNA or RNA helicase
MGVTPRIKYALKAKLKYENIQQVIARSVAKKKYGKIPKSLQWNGTTYLITEKNCFPSGLLTLVTEILDECGEKYQILPQDELPLPNSIALIDEIKPWKHQRDAIDSMKKHMTGIVQIGTGGGKTKASILACSEIGFYPFIFVVNRISLLNQTHDDFSRYFDCKIGYLGDGRIEVGNINIASIGTLCSMLKIKFINVENEEEKLNYSHEQIQMTKDLMAQCKFIIIDECHHGAANTYRTLAKALPKAFYRIGLSATPFRTEESENILLEAAFGKIIYKKTASELILDKILAKPKIYMVQYDDPELSQKYPKTITKNSKSQVFTKIYKECVVENILFNEIVSKCAIANANLNRLTLVSVKQINHGSMILDLIKKINPDITVEFLNGANKKDLNEDLVKKDFADGKIQILISTLFDEGVDIPKIDTVIDAGGGRSAIKALQLTGRAMRKYEGKTKCFVFMFIQPYTYLYKHSKERAAILKTESEFELKLLKWEK